MKRRLEAELLDHLAADDPAAIASRRDLERINLVMRAPVDSGQVPFDFDEPCPACDQQGTSQVDIPCAHCGISALDRIHGGRS